VRKESIESETQAIPKQMDTSCHISNVVINEVDMGAATRERE